MKDRSFATKAAKAAGGHNNQCPVCGDSFTAIRVCSAEKYPTTGAYRFNERIVKACKCNQKEIWG